MSLRPQFVSIITYRANSQQFQPQLCRHLLTTSLYYTIALRVFLSSIRGSGLYEVNRNMRDMP